MKLNNLNEVNLEDIPDNKIYIDLEESFRKILFNKALANSNSNMLKLSSRLNLSYSYSRELKKGLKSKGKRNNIRLNILKKLFLIAKIESYEISKNIKHLRYGRNSYDIPNIFPLKFDHRLASLVAHATGDGHIKDKTYNFEYRNSSDELIKKVYDLIFDIFKIKCKVYSAKDGTKQVETPSIVGYVLYKAGAPTGNKIKSEFDVPVWIKEGDKHIISSYLGALVDDEFCIAQTKVIKFSLSKNIELKENIFNFFESINSLFIKFEIKSYRKLTNKIFVRKDGIRTIVMDLNIFSQGNFIKFKENVPITHKSKIESLNQVVSSYVIKPYEKCHYNRAKELVLNKLKLGNFTTTQLTRESTITRHCFLMHLKKMKSEGLIKEVRRLNYGEILWSF